jgi:CDP-diacylglycerol--serine O-phosphatidyltransferase
MKSKKNFIPGIFTTFNIFCGYLAIIKISEGKIITACWLIIFAMIFDGLDGQVARFIKSPSSFGVEFDSLADVISFGVAPSFLLYHIYFQKFGILGIIMSFSPVVFGSIRLARFNIQLTGFEKTNFSGLPIPIAAGSFISYVIFNYHFWNEIYLTRVLGPQLVFICLLMISTIEYPTFPKITFRAGRRHSFTILFLFSVFTLIIIFPQELLYPASIGFPLWGVMRFLYRILKANGESDENITRQKTKK